MAIRYISEFLGRDANNFNLVRMIAAASVLFGHSWLVTGGETVVEPLYGPTPFAIGQHAVNIFFAVSGLLVAASLDRQSIGGFVRARMLRIYPALIVCLMLITFVMGPLVTSLNAADYFTDGGTYGYFAKTLLVLAGSFPLPGVFTDHVFPDYVNLPVWTLKYEVVCYLALVVAFALGAFRRPSMLVFAFLAATTAYAATAMFPAVFSSIGPFENLVRLGMLFLAGTLAYRFRDRFPISFVMLVAAAIVIMLADGTAFEKPAWALGVAYGTFWFGALPLGALRRFTNRFDYSYGLYIYGWPTLQLLAMVLPVVAPVQLAAIAFSIALPVAAASWYLVEKPALRIKRLPRTPKLSPAAERRMAGITTR